MQLIEACKYNDKRRAHQLIDQYAMDPDKLDVAFQNKSGETALMWTVFQDNIELTRKLLQNGAIKSKMQNKTVQ